jgi:hypothetical protein
MARKRNGVERRGKKLLLLDAVVEGIRQWGSVGGGHWRRTVTTASPRVMSRVCEWPVRPIKRPLWLISGPGSISYFHSFSITRALKFQFVSFLMSKILEILQGDSLKHMEQLYLLAQLQTCSTCQVTNSITNSNLNLPWILKGFKPFMKNLLNSLKFHLQMLYLNINLHWLTCIKLKYWMFHYKWGKVISLFHTP